MKLIKLIKKDLKLFKRDRKTLALTIIAPILILFILGNIFGQTTSSKSLEGISLGICNLDSETSNFEIPLFKIENLDSFCKNQAKELVLTGKLRAAIIIPENFSNDLKNGYGTEILLYIDNSKTQTAIMSSESIKALIQSLNEKIGTEFIKEAWDNLNNLNTKLKFALKQMSIAKEQTIFIQQQLIHFQQNLSEINITDLESQLFSFNQTLSDFTNETNTKLNTNLVLLKEIYNLSCPNKIMPKTCIKINTTLSNSENNNILNTINLTFLNEKIELINKTKEEITLQIKQFNESFFNYTNSLIQATDDLNATTQLLDIYTSRDPKNIVRAVSLNQENVFGEKTYFSFLSPGLILVLLLFTIILVASSNIVYEKKSGTLARTLLSPTSIPMFLFSKILFFLIISFIEIAVMLITIKFFNISIPLTFSIFLVFLISSINFISIGLILGSIANSENTALLSSLVLSLPMLFLSGLFFPFEIMPKFMKIIGSNLPLTLSQTSLDQLITYNTSLDTGTITKIIIMAIIILLLAYFAIKRNPTSN